jgi:hypothetical protein
MAAHDYDPEQHPSFLRAADALRAQADEVIETHCALIFLTGDRALKLKKPVYLGYLDYASLEARRWAIGRELDWNRENAPHLYLAVREVEGEPVLEMRRFDPAAVLAAAPERVDAALSETLGRTVARFHAGAKLAPGGGGAANLAYVIESNADHIRALRLESQATERLVTKTWSAFENVRRLLDDRQAAGCAKRCHGDLHLGNIYYDAVADRPVLFDRIEFSDTLAEIDVLYDLAFLIMDLTFRGRGSAANRVLNAWLDEAARSFGDTVYTGLAALPLMMSMRAGVRCHVSGQMGDHSTAEAYMHAALEHLRAPQRELIAVGGRSGSGKTTRSRALAPELGTAPGAVILRSDEIRKRLRGAGALEPLPPDSYAPEVGEQVYDEMLREAELCLEAGRAVVLDAAFLEPDRREAAEALAADLNVPFRGFWLEAPADVVRQRVAQREGDASDADLAVVEAQARRDVGQVDWTFLSAS